MKKDNIEVIKTGKKIKELRNKKGWSQTELAAKAGYKDKTAISSIENGKSELSQTKLYTFAEVFGVSIACIMCWEDEENDPFAEKDFVLLARYKSLNEDHKKQVENLISFLEFEEKTDKN